MNCKLLSVLAAVVVIECWVPTALSQMIVAHRGASHTAPENTLQAFRLAWDSGADAIEGDFHLSADNRLVCIHDKDTEKTAGTKQIVAATSFEALQRLDVGAWKGDRFRGAKIPSLEQVLETTPKQKKIFIEIKCGPEAVPVLQRVLMRTEFEPHQISVISFDEQVVLTSKAQMPEINALWITSFEQDEDTGEWTPNLDTVLKTAARINADGVDLKAEKAVINREFVEAVREANLQLHCWTIDEPQLAEHFRSLGFESITTNRPELIRAHLERSKAK